jgi:ppGpp synthetase/RelA/SpoT-type nucleotidyltranferase
MTIDEARADWIAVRPEFCDFAGVLKGRLMAMAKGLGVYAEVSSRAKEVPSLVKKLLSKPHLTYETLPDKVGARVIVRYRSEIASIEQCVRERFAYHEVEDKAVKLGQDKVGYQSIHIDSFALLSSDQECAQFPPDRFFGELQIRTLSQHLWSEVSHDTFYKNDELIHRLPPDLRRRVNLTAGLVEVADREFDRMNAEAKPDAAIEVFKGLERLYYSVASRPPDVELSIEVISLVLPLYGSVSPNDVLQNFVYPRFEQSKRELGQLYADPEVDSANASVFFFQPEAFLLLDRLHTDRDELHKKWNERFPEKELDRFATAIGFSLD